MTIILLWMGGLSLVGCIVWAAIFGLTIETGLATLASILAAGIGFRYTSSMRRLKGLEHLGYVYICAAASAFCGFVVLDILELEHVSTGILLTAWPFIVLGLALVYFARKIMKKAGAQR